MVGVTGRHVASVAAVVRGRGVEAVYRASCLCGWVSTFERARWSRADRDGLAHIGQLELPESAPVLPIF